MKISPFWRQVIILSGVIFAAISTGCSTGLATVLIKQFQEPDSPIKVDLEDISWIASTAGMAGLPNALVPGLMQVRGRKLVGLLCVSSVITGWLLTYLGTSIEIILTAMLFHGFGLQSVAVVSVIVISEFATPKYRNFWYNMYVTGSVFGTFLVHLLGTYMNWKKVALICGAPSVLSLIITSFWPETPVWLAWKGRFDECKKVFLAIREIDEDSQNELQKLLQYEIEQKQDDNKVFTIKEKMLAMLNVRQKINDLWQQVKRRDFYLPLYLGATCTCLFYWTGGLAIRIYVNEMIKQTDAFDSLSGIGSTVIDLIVLIGVILFSTCLYKFNNRPLFVYSVLASGILLFIASISLLLREYDLLSKNSYIPMCAMTLYMLIYSIGLLSFPIRVVGDLMPVKHRGLGGLLSMLLLCFYAGSILKVTPYLYVYLGLPALFLIYDLVIFYGFVVLLLYLPETKNKTLLEIEEYYNNTRKIKYVGDLQYDAVADAHSVPSKYENKDLP